MTHKVFWENPYLTDLSTKVTKVEGPDITVKETIFYAFSGGQESDFGTIGGYQVLQATKQEKTIVYTLGNSHHLKSGDSVRMSIDWPRRYRLMRLHFAAEVVLELIPGIEKIGAHISERKARIEFLWPHSLAEILPQIQADANQLVESDQAVISAFSDEKAEQRYWKVDGFAQVPCGGTHIRKTSEVGEVRLKRKTGGKGKERVEIYISDQVREDSSFNYDEAKACR
ncbi:MAG: alanyl-tRNA editing protein [Leptolyngbya sp. SIO4C5]|nr:alanyl-tRNA editing protein [Leptolyngbya sp. SIO4C5]